jgi:hypothetical protein
MRGLFHWGKGISFSLPDMDVGGRRHFLRAVMDLPWLFSLRLIPAWNEKPNESFFKVW